MRTRADFLVEIHTEELPPKVLNRLAKSFLKNIEVNLQKADLFFKQTKSYATPRRLAIFVKALASEQPTAMVERKGPAYDLAFDAQGNPTSAGIGFARSCGVPLESLIRLDTPQGAWLGYRQMVPGKTVQELMPTIITESLLALPMPKRMRWGAGECEFLRPIHAITVLYGKNVLSAEILGITTGRMTRGHRFHSSGWVNISSAAQYVRTLASKYVVADFNERKLMISQQAEQVVKDSLGNNAHVLIDKDLLDEVTGLVEWPVAIGGSFDEAFLRLPPEALISVMQDHQRYFPVLDAEGKLLPHFITISNIASKNVQQVIAGNERVLRARLDDAAFFFQHDKKQKLADRIDALKTVVFQAKLGTLYDKSQRLICLVETLASKLHLNINTAKRAAQLAKTDLLTALVGEFPELQGIAGCYYARHDGEPEEVAMALYEQYRPIGAGAILPETALGCVLAMADKIDILVGAFGINKQPTADKDPFALRRVALGLGRIMVEKKIDLELEPLLQLAWQNYNTHFVTTNTVRDIHHFVQERLKNWYLEQGISPDVYAAVAALNLTNMYNMHLRIQAVQEFRKMPAAESLSAAHKRLNNILAKNDVSLVDTPIDFTLFESKEERHLAQLLISQQAEITPLYQAANYMDVLLNLADLRGPIDEFFVNVRVISDDKPRSDNRLCLLKKLRLLFLQVADIALLQ